MAIVSGIFWIVFGILYIVYRSYKENPADTVAAVLIIGLVVSSIFVWCSIYHAFLEAHSWLGSLIFALVTLGPLFVWWIRSVAKHEKEQEEKHKDYLRYITILYSLDYPEEDFEAYLKKWRRGGSLDQINFDLARTPEEIEKGRAKAFESYAYATGLSRKAWDQVRAEKEERAKREVMRETGDEESRDEIS